MASHSMFPCRRIWHLAIASLFSLLPPVTTLSMLGACAWMLPRLGALTFVMLGVLAKSTSPPCSVVHTNCQRAPKSHTGVVVVPLEDLKSKPKALLMPQDSGNTENNPMYVYVADAAAASMVSHDFLAPKATLITCDMVAAGIWGRPRKLVSSLSALLRRYLGDTPKTAWVTTPTAQMLSQTYGNRTGTAVLEAALHNAAPAVLAVGGLKAGQDGVFGVGCFTRVDAARQPQPQPQPQHRRDLARGYVKEVGSPSSEFGRVAQCDVVEPPLAVFGGPPESLASHLAALALALLRGRGHMASEEAAAFLAAAQSPFMGPGAFGFTPHAMAWDHTYQGARHVPWEMTAWQLWNTSSTCFRSRQAKRRTDTLFKMLQALEEVERDEPLLHRVDPIFGSMLMGVKLGTVPPWENDIDMVLTINENRGPGPGTGPRMLKDQCTYVGQRIAAAMVARGLRIGEWITGFGPETAEWDDGRGRFVPKRQVRALEMSDRAVQFLVRPVDGQSSFIPHWKSSCDDLRERVGGSYDLNEELWDICRERIRRLSERGVVKGYWSEGYGADLFCTRRGMEGRERLPFYRVALAGPDSSIPAVVLPGASRTAAEDQLLVPVADNWSLKGYGKDVLGHPWGCYGSF